MPADKTGSQAEGDLGDLVRGRRRELGLSRNDLVEASGLSYPYVAQIETGRRTPSRKSTARLAEALRLPPEALDAVIPFDDDTPRASAPPTSRRRSGWHDNPAFAAAVAVSAPALDEGPEPLEVVLGALAPLSPTERLRVLAEAQRQVLDELA